MGQIRAFQKVLAKVDLGDLEMRRVEFTWCNMREENQCR